MSRTIICLCISIALGLSSSCFAKVVIGSWEDQNDGWYDFNDTDLSTEYVDNPQYMPSRYQYSTTWSSLGTHSLWHQPAGWEQTLAVNVNYSNFMDYTQFKVDIHCVGSGWTQIYTFALNTDAFAWTNIGTAPLLSLGGGETSTLTVNYKPYKKLVSNPPQWLQFIMATNGDGSSVMYFDNARLETLIAHGPSPADEAREVGLTPTLSWLAGSNTQGTNGHNVYFGTDFNDVNDANSTDTTGIYLGARTDPNYAITTPPLAAGILYYWRVDEVNNIDGNSPDGNSPWKGDVWSFNTLGPATIKKCTIKAGKTQAANDDDVNNMKDSIVISGTTAFPSDVNKTTQLGINIISVADDNEVIYLQTITDFNSPNNLDKKGTKISYSHKLVKYHAGEVTSLKMDFVKGTFSLTAKNVDLTGLSAPVKLEFVMSGNTKIVVTGQADETIINGSKKLIPTRLMRMYQDTLIVTKAKAKNSTKALSDSLSIKGEIAIQDINNTNLNEPNLAARDVNFVWGNQVFSVLTEDFVAAKTGHKYTCKKIQSDANDGEVAAKFDLDKCTFTLTVKKAENLYALPDHPDVNFSMNYGINDANDFNETADVNLVTHRSY